MIISAAYQELKPEEIDGFESAWQHPDLPVNQYERALLPDIRKWREGRPVPPFDAFRACWRKMTDIEQPSMLDVGAALGHYAEVVGLDAGSYTAIDYSEPFKKFALMLYPGIQYDIGDACALPYKNESFDVVLHSGCLMHLKDWVKAIKEAARVAKRYVIFNRTPITGETRHFKKEAYGVPCLETHFGIEEFITTCDFAQLERRFETQLPNCNHRSFLFEKRKVAHHHV